MHTSMYDKTMYGRNSITVLSICSNSSVTSQTCIFILFFSCWYEHRFLLLSDSSAKTVQVLEKHCTAETFWKRKTMSSKSAASFFGHTVVLVLWFYWQLQPLSLWLQYQHHSRRGVIAAVRVCDFILRSV